MSETAATIIGIFFAVVGICPFLIMGVLLARKIGLAERAGESEGYDFRLDPTKVKAAVRLVEDMGGTRMARRVVGVMLFVAVLFIGGGIYLIIE